jgi:hypothetical protein
VRLHTGLVLAISPCLSLCDWTATGARTEGAALFRCGGCGSEWVRSERWTPRQHDGTVPPAVLEELQRG